MSLRLAASLGIGIADWEDMTPVQLNLYARAWAERRQEEQRLAQVNLYSLSALIRSMVWSKHPPSFERAFPEHGQKQGAMDDGQLYETVKGLNALFGGTEVV